MDFILEEKKRKKIAAIITAVIGLLLLLFMWLMRAWNTFDPPLVESGTVLEFGWTSEGSGNVEAEVPQDNPNPVEEASSQIVPTQTVDQVSEEFVTDENSQIEIEQKEESKEVSKTETETENKEEVKEEEKNSDKLNNALNNAWNETAGGDGSSNETGNEGDPKGDKNSKGVLDTGGEGAFGDGAGRYVGNSIKVTEKPEASGIIVLDIYVDRNGKYLRSVYNMAKSNSTELSLINLAKRSASKTARFHADPNSPVEQKISVRFIFELK